MRVSNDWLNEVVALGRIPEINLVSAPDVCSDLLDARARIAELERERENAERLAAAAILRADAAAAALADRDRRVAERVREACAGICDANANDAASMDDQPMRGSSAIAREDAKRIRAFNMDEWLRFDSMNADERKAELLKLLRRKLAEAIRNSDSAFLSALLAEGGDRC